jgi:hypothetical protein
MRNGCYDLGGTRSIKDIIEQADSVLARVRAWWSAYSFGWPKRTKVACLGLIRQWNRSKFCFHSEPNHTEERQFFFISFLQYDTEESQIYFCIFFQLEICGSKRDERYDSTGLLSDR